MPKPVVYKLTFNVPGYPGRDDRCVVVAMDVEEAIKVARGCLRHRVGVLQDAKLLARHVLSEGDMPDAISEAVLRMYAGKMGFTIATATSITGDQDR